MRRLLEWKYMNQPNNNSSNYPSQEENYKKLLAQIDKEKQFTYTIVSPISKRLLDIDLKPTNGQTAELSVIYKPYVPSYLVKLNNDSNYYDTFEDVLDLLINKGIIKDKSFYSSSVAEDFKIYNNLWSE